MDTTPEADSPYSDNPGPQPISSLLSGRTSKSTPLVLLIPEGTYAIVLRRSGGTVEVFANGAVQRLAAHHHAVGVTDDDRRNRLISQALAVLATERHDSAAEADQLKVEADTARATVESARHDVRRYLIGLQRTDAISRDALDGFLEHFGMDPYRPRIRVVYRLVGHYDLDDDDLSRARRDAETFLRPHLDDIDNLVPYSGEQQVTLTHIGHVD